MKNARFWLLVCSLVAAGDAAAQSVASRMCRQADGSLRWQDGSAPCPTLSAPGGGGFNPYAAMAPALGAMSFQFGAALMKSLMGSGDDSAAVAAQQARQREADQAALAQARAQEENRQEQMKNRLLAMMMMPGGSQGVGYMGVSSDRPQFTFDEAAFAPSITTLPPGSASAQLTQAAYYSDQAAQAKSDEDIAALADAAFSGALGLPTEVPVPSSTKAIQVPDSDVPRVQSVREGYRATVESSSEAYAEVVQARQRAEASRLALEQAGAELASAREAFMKSKKAARKAQQTLVAHKEAEARKAQDHAADEERRLAEAQANFQKAQVKHEEAARAVFDLVDFVRNLARRPDGAYQRGVNEGSSCLTANAANYCSAHPDVTSCAERYMTGYRVGDRAMQEKLRAAYAVGQQTRANGGSSFAGFNHPNAVGPCRVKWLESFNNGFFGAPFTLVGR